MDDQLTQFLASGITAGDLVLALLIGVAGWIAGSLAHRALLRGLPRVRGLKPAQVQLIARVAKAAILIIGLSIALSFLGGSAQPLLVVVLIVAVIAVLALRGIADNFSAGVVLQARNPVLVGQEIEVDDITGVVTEMNSRSTVVRMADGRTVHLPNSTLLNSPMYNNSENGARRSEVQVRMTTPRADYSLDDLRAALAEVTVLSAIAGHPLELRCVTAGDTELTTSVLFWHDALTGAQARSQAVAGIHDALRAHGVSAVVTSDVPRTPYAPTPPL